MAFLRRLVLAALLIVALLYAGLCVVLWLQQDALVFPGAGRGDRGVPVTTPAAVVGWLPVDGAGEGARVRTATLATNAPRAVVVYLGGNGEDLFAAVGSAAALAAHGVEVITAEYPGYGASPGRPGVAALLATARAVTRQAAARAGALGVPCVVVGSSLGTFGALHAAAQGGVARVVLRAPPTRLLDVARTSFSWLPVGLLLRHPFDNLAAAPQVSCPVLVLHGTADTVVPERFGRELAAALPQASFVAVPGFGHNDLDLGPSGPAAAALRTFLGW